MQSRERLMRQFAAVRDELAKLNAMQRFNCNVERRKIDVPDTEVPQHTRRAHVRYAYLPPKRRAA